MKVKLLSAAVALSFASVAVYAAGNGANSSYRLQAAGAEENIFVYSSQSDSTVPPAVNVAQALFDSISSNASARTINANFDQDGTLKSAAIVLYSPWNSSQRSDFAAAAARYVQQANKAAGFLGAQFTNGNNGNPLFSVSLIDGRQDNNNVYKYVFIYKANGSNGPEIDVQKTTPTPELIKELQQAKREAHLTKAVAVNLTGSN